MFANCGGAGRRAAGGHHPAAHSRFLFALMAMRSSPSSRRKQQPGAGRRPRPAPGRSGSSSLTAASCASAKRAGDRVRDQRGASRSATKVYLGRTSQTRARMALRQNRSERRSETSADVAEGIERSHGRVHRSVHPAGRCFPTVVSLLILLVGLMAGTRLQVRQYPRTVADDDQPSPRPIRAPTPISSRASSPFRSRQAVASTEGVDTIVSKLAAEYFDDHPQPASQRQFPTGR